MVSILSFLGKIQDIRKNQGKRYKLKSILGLVILGYICGCKSLFQIYLFGQRLGLRYRKQLGFKGSSMPSHPTITETIKKIDPTDLESVLGQIVNLDINGAFRQISIDGKSINSTNTSKEGLLHLLSAYVPQMSGVLMQVKSEPAGGEIKAATDILSKIDIRGKVVTGDAMFAQEMLCHKIVSNAGDYVFKVKGNKKRIIEDINQGFIANQNNGVIKRYEAPPQKAHGRIETRIIEALPVERKYFGGWATNSIKTFARITRKCYNIKQAKETEEISHIISSMQVPLTSAQALLEFSVNHWQIENKLHRTRDTTFREDVCNILCHKSQEINAALRNLAIFLLSKVHSSITTAISSLAHNIRLAVPLLFRRI